MANINIVSTLILVCSCAIALAGKYRPRTMSSSEDELACGRLHGKALLVSNISALLNLKRRLADIEVISCEAQYFLPLFRAPDLDCRLNTTCTPDYPIACGRSPDGTTLIVGNSCSFDYYKCQRPELQRVECTTSYRDPYLRLDAPTTAGTNCSLNSSICRYDLFNLTCGRFTNNGTIIIAATNCIFDYHVCQASDLRRFPCGIRYSDIYLRSVLEKARENDSMANDCLLNCNNRVDDREVCARRILGMQDESFPNMCKFHYERCRDPTLGMVPCRDAHRTFTLEPTDANQCNGNCSDAVRGSMVCAKDINGIFFEVANMCKLRYRQCRNLTLAMVPCLPHDEFVLTEFITSQEELSELGALLSVP